MYVLDTNIFIDWWERRYPPDLFPSFQQRFDALVLKNEVVAPELVYSEIRWVAGKPLINWAKKNKKIFVPHDVKLQQEATNILHSFPGMIDQTATYDEADRWIIAMANCNGYIVVTHETPAKSKRRPPRTHYIPDVCMALNIPCINLLELMRREKWSF
jgi:predicted nucleic acid-binding protein